MFKQVTIAICVIGSFLSLSSDLSAYNKQYGLRAGEMSTQFGGYFDTELFFNEDSSQTFRAHRLILGASAQPHERLFFNTEIEFEYGADVNTTRDKGEIKIEQAWLDFMFSEALVFRSGIVLVPFGRLNKYHDSDMRDATNRPLYAKKIIPTTWMDTGAGVHGNLETEALMLNYEAYLINGLADTSESKDDVTAANGIRKTRPEFKSDNNSSMALAGRVGVSPALGSELGVSYYTGSLNDESTDLLTIIGFDLSWKKGPVELVGEWAQTTLENAGSRPEEMFGYYLEGRYHLSGKWLKESALGKGFRRPVLTLFARIGEVDTDTKVDDINDVTQTTLGINYRPIETAVYKLEYEMNTEKVGNKEDNAIIASVAFGF